MCSKEESITINPYQIGDVGPAGGKIFYIDEANEFDWNYLECNTDENGIGNYCFGYYRPDGTNNEVVGTDTAIGTGEKNTKDLVEKMGATAYTEKTGTDTALYAAKVAYDYEQNGYDDWFLPSKDELNEICINREDLGLPKTDYWWSSSEKNGYNAWSRSFNDGTQSGDFRYIGSYIRPIRAF